MTRRLSLLRFRRAFQLLLLAVVITSLQPAPVLVAVGVPQSVQTSYPILGVHTRLTDEVEEWKIQRSLQMAREMGAQWIVEFFPWAYYHAEGGGFAWQHPDMVIKHARAQGLRIIARIGLTPEWARPPDTPLTYLDESAYDDFATFAAAFAARYRGQVDYLLVGNEPNLSYEWGYRPVAADDYVNLLRVVYPAVKAANPDLQILAGALAPNLEPPGSPWAVNDLEYLEQMYQLGAAEFFDGLAAHAYGLTFPPDAEPAENVLNFRRIELQREIMVAYGDAETPIVVTETGWNDHPRWSLGVRPGQRIDYTLSAISFAESHWPFVEVVAFWALRYPAPTQSYPDYYTFVNPEFVAKPIYEAVKDFTGN